MNAHDLDDRGPSPDLVERIEHLLRSESYSSPLDIRLVSSGEGCALLEMEITEARTNVKGTCHGGALFTLADMAFGVAALREGPIVTVTSDLHFVRPGRRGDVVRASARQVSRTKRNGLFQISIAGSDGGIIAVGLFKGQWVSPDTPLRAGHPPSLEGHGS